MFRELLPNRVRQVTCSWMMSVRCLSQLRYCTTLATVPKLRIADFIRWMALCFLRVLELHGAYVLSWPITHARIKKPNCVGCRLSWLNGVMKGRVFEMHSGGRI
ncbi:hypothetical protein DFR72_105302 [Lentzea flaviverrucosa]|uniref:Uncharacterized protein n=1 Tax=Lentzea flaviverrucosa TaxID=200379 RepID=A0A1H9PDW0_9PSEU|nr:hypothetical protein DFR72_105302 [Lentzea flaviverrucosa]SER46416.1 hypothetical protein SAMN05216195_105270 [Lentzea flaviverrucosa]